MLAQNNLIGGRVLRSTEMLLNLQQEEVLLHLSPFLAHLRFSPSIVVKGTTSTDKQSNNRIEDYFPLLNLYDK